MTVFTGVVSFERDVPAPTLEPLEQHTSNGFLAGSSTAFRIGGNYLLMELRRQRP